MHSLYTHNNCRQPYGVSFMDLLKLSMHTPYVLCSYGLGLSLATLYVTILWLLLLSTMN